MILVTGGTGFIGRALIRHLVEDGKQVRTLIRPSKQTPSLPRGVPVEAAISSVTDPRGLRAALVGVEAVFHLAGVEWRGASTRLHQIEITGARNLVEAAREAGVERIFFLSHLGADRASAYPVLKAKGIAEERLRRSGLDYTILRSGLVFGPNDNFTTGIARLLYAFPFVFPVPGDGQALVQPLWVEDLVTILTWALDDDGTRNQVYEIGGPEHLTIAQVVTEVMNAVGVRRTLWYVRPSYMRIAGVLSEYLFPGLPLSVYWLDYLASSRTVPLDSVPRQFGLLPARLPGHLNYLRGQRWWLALLRDLFRSRSLND